MYNNSTKLIVIIAFLFVFGCDNNAQSSEKINEKPNIILIIADDLGWADVGYNGNEDFETPNIDKLAADGMVFNRFYAPASNCAPSRACLLTGMYTPRHQVYIPQGLAHNKDVTKMRWKVPTRGQNSTFNTFSVSINTVSPEFESLAELLNKSGYVTTRIGKWHIGDDNQGFDVSSAIGVMGEVTNYCGTEKRYYDDVHSAEKLTDAALSFMEDNKNNPFFLYLSHWEVHSPWVAQKERIQYYKEKFKNRSDKDPIYAAMVEQVDLSVGRVLKKVKELNIEKNTVVIFTSDNGGSARITQNFPLRAGKGTYYEGGIRVPFCIKWPGIIKSGSKTVIPISGVDFMPTFAEIASAELPSDQPVDGTSIVSILNGKEDLFDKERSIFFHFPLYAAGNKKEAVLPTFDGEKNFWRAVPLSVIISGDWKLIYYYEYERYELYNLKEDISELNDLSVQKTGIAMRLLEELQSWTKNVNAPVPSVLNDKRKFSNEIILK